MGLLDENILQTARYIFAPTVPKPSNVTLCFLHTAQKILLFFLQPKGRAPVHTDTSSHSKCVCFENTANSQVQQIKFLSDTGVITRFIVPQSGCDVAGSVADSECRKFVKNACSSFVSGAEQPESTTAQQARFSAVRSVWRGGGGSQEAGQQRL